MIVKTLAARFALVFSCALMTATPAFAQFWQCAPYAREISGIDLHGNANTWWGQAAGRYERGHAPKVGAVLAFQSTRRMRVGHVAMVSQVVSDREVLLTHANWSRPGGIERNVRAIDVSAAGDWSEVKVWYGPNGGLGTSSYPTNGFIYSGHAPAIDTDAAPASDAAVDTSIIATAAAVPVVPVAGR
ncbi:chap [Sphingomonas taxi]|uniref:Chap n=1 Tax=Sphingomonas taxi TaxID=1549858 RepID=A0A097EGW4_9SPHN|nr:chap [Sphingomonas taxi]